MRVGAQEVGSRLTPAAAVSDDELMIVNAIFEPLIKLDKDGKPAPFLLEKLPVESDDKLTYYFKLKDGIYFHNGKKLDTADVIFTIQEVVKDRKAAYSWIFRNIDGAADYRSGKKKSLEGLKVVDSLRFQIRLKKPDPDFAGLLSLPAAAIMAAGIDHRRSPVGTGPFLWREKRARKEIVLTANTRYHGGRPYLDTILFRLIPDPEDALLEYKTEKLDATPLLPGSLQGLRAEAAGLAVQSPVKRIVFLDMNPQKPPLDNPMVRKQVVFAIDRASIIDVILSGEGTPENYVPDSQKVRVDRVGSGGPHELWYAKDDPVHAFVAERLKVYLFERMGMAVKLAGKDKTALLDDGAGAPSFRLRSLPILSSRQKTVEKTLFEHSFRSPHSAMMVRHGSGDQVGFDDIPVVFLYSHSRSLFVSGRFNEPELTARGGMGFAELFLKQQTE